ncbi:MAG: hypothetical protein R3362_08025 [Rhodothermales bacterium]|nr:hypothetical protein [Rhodothermales bacterium]
MTTTSPLRSHRPLVLALLTLPLLTLAACDSGDPEEERVGISGFWVGELVYNPPGEGEPDRTFPIQLTLRDDVNTVTGSGVVELPGERLDFTVTSGLFDSRLRTVSLALQFDRPPQGTLSGNVSPERDFIDGTFGGPGIANGEVELSLNLQRAP